MVHRRPDNYSDNISKYGVPQWLYQYRDFQARHVGVRLFRAPNTDVEQWSVSKDPKALAVDRYLKALGDHDLTAIDSLYADDH